MGLVVFIIKQAQLVIKIYSLSDFLLEAIASGDQMKCTIEIHGFLWI